MALDYSPASADCIVIFKPEGSAHHLLGLPTVTVERSIALCSEAQFIQ